MRIIKSCEDCLYEKQIERVKDRDKGKREQYLGRIRQALNTRGEDDSSPYMVYEFNKIYREFFGEVASYQDIKREYNELVLSMEDEIEAQIVQALDPLKTSMVYARIGNYIDFGAMNQVDKDTFLSLFDVTKDSEIDQDVYEEFLEKCRRSNDFLLLCDNCGEIVLDKLFIRQLKRRFPNLTIHVMVRGEEVLNDATMEDAVFCGMDKEAMVMGNGNGVAGTVPAMMSEEARQVFEEADVILAKGQGNYETMAGNVPGAFYLFLCKCDLFMRRFGVERLTGMFVKEA